MSLLEQSRTHPRPLKVLAGDRVPFTADSIEAAPRFDFLVQFIRETAPRWRQMRSVNHEEAREFETALRFAMDLIRARLEAWQPIGETN